MIWLLKSVCFEHWVPKTEPEVLRHHRVCAVRYFLKTEGPLTSAQLARRLYLPTTRVNQWMQAQSWRFDLWVRMPNMRWLLLEEEPGEELDGEPLEE